MASQRPLIAGVTGLVAGVVLWKNSIIINGTVQPWGGASPAYLVCLFVAGAFVAAIEPEQFWVSPLSIYAGQALVLTAQGLTVAASESGAAYPLSLVFLVSYSLPSVAGAAITAVLLTWHAQRPGS